MSISARSWRAALRQSSRRNLSTSAVRQRHTLPTFEPSSTPDLDGLLDLARRRILIPAHLNAAQRTLVYREEHRARLSADAPEPLYSTVAGADVALEHIDRQRDVPARWAVLSRALALAETRADWENVGRLLEGLGDAGVRLRDAWAEKFVRDAAAKGQLHVVLRALQRAERSGVRLRALNVVERVAWEVRGVAARSGWGEAETERAFAYAERVVELMEAKEHCGGNRKVERGDLRTLPFVIATPLELAATLALRYRDGVDKDGVVKAYAERLCANLNLYGTQEPIPGPAEESAAPEQDPETTAEQEAAKEEAANAKQPKPPTRYELFIDAAHKLRRLVPVWHGLTLAQRVLRDNMPLSNYDTYHFATELREQIDGAVKVMQENLKEGQSIDNHADVLAWREIREE